MQDDVATSGANLNPLPLPGDRSVYQLADEDVDESEHEADGDYDQSENVVDEERNPLDDGDQNGCRSTHGYLYELLEAQDMNRPPPVYSRLRRD